MNTELQRLKKRYSEWENRKEPFCSHCLYEATRHYWRNCDPLCSASDEDHPDGDELSDTVVDIWKLIHMIDRLEQENDHLRKQVEIMRKERG